MMNYGKMMPAKKTAKKAVVKKAVAKKTMKKSASRGLFGSKKGM